MPAVLLWSCQQSCTQQVYQNCYRICPSLAGESFYISRCVNSSVTTPIAAGRHLQSSQVTRCSATKGVPADVKGQWHAMGYPYRESASHLLAHMGISVSPSTVLHDLHWMNTPVYENVKEGCR
ncbi:MAG: hypothetical protein SOY65_04880 [Marinifilaceae bacterium]|nr:hypothetical protein [Marinifilaceae bacterium]